MSVGSIYQLSRRTFLTEFGRGVFAIAILETNGNICILGRLDQMAP